MLITIPDVLNVDEIKLIRQLLQDSVWIDGGVTAGHQSTKVKDNLQLKQDDRTTIKVGEMILRALAKNPLFMIAALPKEIFPPLFNRYAGGQSFGSHVDNAIRYHPRTNRPIRTDLSCTLFISEPHEYMGGELCIRDKYGIQKVKLPAGQMVIYPSTSVHYVTPVTSGARVCSFFWLESLVQNEESREILFDLDIAIQKLATDFPEHQSLVDLTNTYHNLLRMWATT